MITFPFLIHALSPLHAGTGQSAGIVDLPTARMQATGIPFVPGSTIKGVLRDARKGQDSGGKVSAVFGPDADNASDHAGALAVGDARLLCLPVRSFRGTFAWITSPLLLALAKRDLGWPLTIPDLQGRIARVTSCTMCVHNEDRLYLDDLDLPTEKSAEVDNWAKRLAPLVSPGDDIFSKRFALVDDDTMTFLWETATQVDTRVRLDETTRTVAPGALWLEESLPSETLLLGVFAADRSRNKTVPMTGEEVRRFALPGEEVLQLGGKASVGRGRCRVVPVS